MSKTSKSKGKKRVYNIEILDSQISDVSNHSTSEIECNEVLRQTLISTTLQLTCFFLRTLSMLNGIGVGQVTKKRFLLGPKLLDQD